MPVTVKPDAAPATSLEFAFGGLRGDPSAQPLATLLITPKGFAGLENHASGLRAHVALLNAPPTQLQPLQLKAEWLDGNSVITTLQGGPQVGNRLAFALINRNRQPVVPPGTLWTAGMPPSFSVHFVYANEPQHSRGALCMKDLAVRRAAPPAPAPTLRASDAKFSVAVQQSSAGPYWAVMPDKVSNQQVLGTALDASLELVFEGVVCDTSL